VEEEHELIASKLQLKKNGGGYRHYIKAGKNDQDICCGAIIEVKLTDDHLGGWLTGRYEARLTEPVEAYLAIGDFFPSGRQAMITIPLGTMVRVRKIIVGQI
jgi:hypothetical protein